MQVEVLIDHQMLFVGCYREAQRKIVQPSDNAEDNVF